ncbi:DUF6479 family protein [Streptomyces sp. NRRL B-24484]|uniref:DUF6479 family protein n=1 Tax=Streptomyces sp. NRRL B-24484 TaxID=1463833 RepID=UPI0004BE88A1|nr:DUF6479 family protein [Streptomyces sp. NRRL B-24484]
MTLTNPARPADLAALAADGSGPHLWLIAAGAALVVVLVLAFVLGRRRKDREPPPVDLPSVDLPPEDEATPGEGRHRRL